MSESVDMSAEAIDRRLRELGELWQVWERMRRDLGVAAPTAARNADDVECDDRKADA